MPSKRNTAAAAEAPEATTTFDVTSPLKHDGEFYDIGSQVELTEAQAAPLLEVQAVKPAAAASGA